MKKELFAALNRTLWGRRYIKIEDANGCGHTLIAKDLELQDKVWIDFIYEQALSDGREKNLVPSSELAVFLEKAGVWTKNEELSIKNMRKSLSKINETLEDPEITKREIKITNKIKGALLESLNKKTSEKNVHYSNSLETFAEHQRVHATLVSMLYETPEKRYWDTWGAFEKETDNIFVDNAIHSVFNKPDVTIEMIRKISRSPEWRFKWNAYKNSGDLFGKPLMELTIDQESLVYWSQVYDAAYESYERPADNVINDDEALDKWFEDQSNKRKRESLEKQSSNSTSKVGSSKIWRHGEVGIVANDVLRSDINRAAKMGLAKEAAPTMSIEEIHDLNDPLAKKFIAHQNKKIKKYGVIEERDLRSDGNSRRAIGSKDAVFKRAKRRDGFTGKQITDTKPGGTLKGKRN